MPHGIFLMLAAILDVGIANLPLAPLYDSLIDLPMGIRSGEIEKSAAVMDQ